jgi:hypothetical protein
MATTTISTYADELQAYIESGKKMESTLSFTKAYAIPFVHTFSAETSASVALAIIPRGARIISGSFGVSATMGSASLGIGLAARDGLGYIDDVASGSSTSTAGAAVTTAQSDAVECLKATATLTNTTQVGFALTSALGFLYEAQKELYLTCTVSVAAAGTQVLRGYVLVAYP